MTRSPKSNWCEFEGYIMRSIAESRVAGMLSGLGIAYLYEHMPYGFTGYLPDFYLPALDAFIEVKGAEPTPLEVEKCERLHDRTGCPVVLVHGRPQVFQQHDDYPRTEVSWSPRALIAGQWGSLSVNTICQAVYRGAGKVAGERFAAAIASRGVCSVQPIGPAAVKLIHEMSAKAGRPCRVIYQHNAPINAAKIASPAAVSPAERLCLDFIHRRHRLALQVRESFPSHSAAGRAVGSDGSSYGKWCRDELPVPDSRVEALEKLAGGAA